jgi:hypothetical protein
MYFYVGELWTKGVLPYKQIFDNKPPGIFAVAAAASATHHILWATAVIHFFVTIGCIITVRRLLQSCGASEQSVTAGTVLAALMVNFHIYAAGNMSEAYLLWPMAASMLFFMRGLESGKIRHVFLAGVCTGIACFFKPFGASALLAQLVYTTIYILPRRTNALLWNLVNAIGVIAAWIPVLAYFAAHEALQQMLYASFFYSIHYGLYAQPGAFGAVSILLQRLMPVSAPLVCLFLGFAGLLKGGSDFEPAEAAVWKLSLLWFAADLLLILAAGKGFDQYFLSLMPVLALVAALFIWRFEKSAADVRLHKPVMALILVPICLAYFQGNGAFFREVLSAGAKQSPEDAVVEQIQKAAKPGSTLLVSGYQPWLFYATQLRPATRYESTSYVYDSPMSYSRVGSEILNGFQASPPDLVVVMLDVKMSARWNVGIDTFKDEFDRRLRESYSEIWRDEEFKLYRLRT